MKVYCTLVLTMKYLIIVFCIVFGCALSGAVDFGPPLENPDCVPLPKGRVPWILAVRDQDYGWREDTHRANIALAVAHYNGSDEEMKRMGLQLEVEITKALLRKADSPIDDGDLALFIHALIATNRNPRDFHGTDLVADLIHRVDKTRGAINPFLVLTLVNSYAVEPHHLQRLRDIVNLNHLDVDHPDVDSRQVQLKALALKAYACAESLNPRFKFTEEMKQATDCLKAKYNKTDGTFGNVYTTALAVQAFMANDKRIRQTFREWDDYKTLSYLEKESEIDVNLVKAYYLEMALNARNVKCLKDLYKGQIVAPESVVPTKNHYIHYSIKNVLEPDLFFTISLKVSEQTNFYEIMKNTSKMTDRYRFSAYENERGHPMVYAVSGVPNDAEENMFWRICRDYNVDHRTHTSTREVFNDSPKLLIPNPNESVTFLYSDTECPKT